MILFYIQVATKNRIEHSVYPAFLYILVSRAGYNGAHKVPFEAHDLRQEGSMYSTSFKKGSIKSVQLLTAVYFYFLEVHPQRFLKVVRKILGVNKI